MLVYVTVVTFVITRLKNKLICFVILVSFSASSAQNPTNSAVLMCSCVPALARLLFYSIMHENHANY